MLWCLALRLASILRPYSGYGLILTWSAFLCAICCLELATLKADERRLTLLEGPSFRSISAAAARKSPADIRINVDLKLIPVTVTDARARAITGLQKNNFKLFEDKTEQVISHFASEDEPVSIGLLFDSSGSMGPKLSRSREAVSEFLKAANPQDEFFLVLFSDRARLATGFTTNADEITRRLDVTESKGRTAMFDGVHLALHQIKEARYSRKAILIISDGGDNHSRYTFGSIMSELREADVQVYSIGILEPLVRRNSLEIVSGPTLLDQIAQATGGRLFEANNPVDLREAASRIGTALRNQYLLGYLPANSSPVGKYHRLEVRIERPKGFPPLRVSFPSGYYAR
jgi:VWFA-related protein